MKTLPNIYTRTGLTVIAVGIAFAVSAVFAVPTQAQDSDSLQEQIDQLLEQIAALQAELSGDTSAGIAGVPAGYNWNRNLTVGSTGQDVRYLQIAFNSSADTRVAVSGAGSPGNETSYFGPLTRAAAVKFQEKHATDILHPLGLFSGTGFVGNSTRAKLNQMSDAPAPTPTPDPDEDEEEEDEEEQEEDNGLSGGEGFITVDDLSLGSVDIDLGDTEVVYELEVEAEDSDVEINRVDFRFNQRPWLYFDEVRLMVDGSEVGVLFNSSDYTEVSGGGFWRGRFSGLNEIIRENDTADISLEVVVHSSLSGTRDQDTVQIQMREDAIRFIDGAGIIGYGPDSNLDTVDVTFDDSFGEGDMDIVINDNSPDEKTFVVDETSRTNDQEVLIFDIEAENDDVTVDEVDVVFTNTATSTINNMIRRTRLYADGTLIGTEAISGTASTTMTVTFDDLDYDIDEDDVVEFSVEVDFYETDRSGFEVPATLEVVLDEVRGEDSDFESITKSNLAIGSGEMHDVVVESVLARFKSESTSVNDDGTKGTYDLTFELSAVGETFYITDNVANEGTTPADGFAYVLTGATTTLANGVESATISNVSGSGVSESGGVIKINKGSTATITLKVVLDPDTGDSAGFYGVQLDNYHITTNSNGTTSVTEVDVSSRDIETDQEHLSIN